MKKIIALLLLAITCLSFVACNSNNDKDVVIVGRWYCEEEEMTLEISSEGTGTFTDNDKTSELTWTFDDASRLIILVVDDRDGEWTQECTYLEESDTIYGDGLSFKRVK